MAEEDGIVKASSTSRSPLFEKHPLLVALKKSQHAMKVRLSDFYATTTSRYASTIAAMSQDILDDEEGVDEFSLK